MPFAYVTVSPSLEASGGRVHALLLPTSSEEWPELAVKYSHLGGFGVHPGRSKSSSINWSELKTPVMLPYLGAETVTKDAHTQRQLIAVLKGRFERLTVKELRASGGGQFVADGLFAVPANAAPAASARGDSTRILGDSIELLQVSDGAPAGDDGNSVCYLLAEETRMALHLHGHRRHLFDLLCAHGRHEHADRHLATHVATLQRKEEGYIFINAHPAFLDGMTITGMVNEPAAHEGATLKMVQGYARLLEDGEPLLMQLGLTQPKDAAAAWRRSIVPPEGGGTPSGVSEKMVLYATTRRSYEASKELTVDYGKSYMRDYASGAHRAAPQLATLYAVPRDRLSTAQKSTARWPTLPGWFNPTDQPQARPAFKVDAASGAVALVADQAEIVKARKAALGTPRTAAAHGKADSRSSAGSPPLSADGSESSSGSSESGSSTHGGSGQQTPSKYTRQATLFGVQPPAAALTTPKKESKLAKGVSATTPSKSPTKQSPRTQISGVKRAPSGAGLASVFAATKKRHTA